MASHLRFLPVPVPGLVDIRLLQVAGTGFIFSLSRLQLATNATNDADEKDDEALAKPAHLLQSIRLTSFRARIIAAIKSRPPVLVRVSAVMVIVCIIVVLVYLVALLIAAAINRSFSSHLLSFA